MSADSTAARRKPSVWGSVSKLYQRVEFPAYEKCSDMSDPVILSYFDSLLRQSDIALLEKPNWLNDKIIGFAFQYYQEVILHQWPQRRHIIWPIWRHRNDILGSFQKARCLFCRSQCDSNGKIMFFAF